MDMGRGEERVRCMERVTWKLTLEKAMAPHSSALAWRIPGRGSLVGCRLWDCTESDTTEATSQQQQNLIYRVK